MNPFITKIYKIIDTNVNDMNLESNDDSKDVCSASKLKKEEQESSELAIASPNNSCQPKEFALSEKDAAPCSNVAAVTTSRVHDLFTKKDVTDAK